MTMTASGVLRDARPNQPQEPAYTTPNVPLRGLNLGGKYSDDIIQNGTLPLALHHVIPWNSLRDFWNEMRQKEYWKTMAVYGSLVGVTQADMAKFINQGMKKSRFGDPVDLDAKICWAEWNLVRGPKHRSDDPGEELDDMQSTYGKAANNTRIKSLIQYGQQMKRWLVAMPREDDVRTLVDSMKREFNRKKIMEFDSNIWRVQSDSPTFVSGSAAAPAVQPRWYVRGKVNS